MHLIFSSAGLQALSKFLQWFCTGVMYKKWISSCLVYLTFPIPPEQVFLWNLVALSQLYSCQCYWRDFLTGKCSYFFTLIATLASQCFELCFVSEELITLAKPFASLKCTLQVCYVHLSYFIEHPELEGSNKCSCLFWVFVSLLFNNFNFLQDYRRVDHGSSGHPRAKPEWS